jgi:hypothetical protein
MRRCDYSSRGVLPSVACPASVIAKPHKRWPWPTIGSKLHRGGKWYALLLCIVTVVLEKKCLECTASAIPLVSPQLNDYTCMFWIFCPSGFHRGAERIEVTVLSVRIFLGWTDTLHRSGPNMVWTLQVTYRRKLCITPTLLALPS